jgi:hypothetical protein
VQVATPSLPVIHIATAWRDHMTVPWPSGPLPVGECAVAGSAAMEEALLAFAASAEHGITPG